MRLLLLLLFISTQSFAQVSEFDDLLQSGKNVFFEQTENPDYDYAVEVLEKAVKLEPNNPEAHYFLGYAYSRVNANFGQDMMGTQMSMLEKISAEFELVNKLSPKYEGELVVLDPYSKLSSEWGSMAMYYMNNNKPDSTRWAFEEGKKRGGFSKFYLSSNRKVLDDCAPNSILISRGDNSTFNLWYLQSVENYRPDVDIIDVSLLNTTWYPEYLRSVKNISFGEYHDKLDTLEYRHWEDSVVSISTIYGGNFSWTMEPRPDGNIWRGDMLLLGVLKDNAFEREVYFTKGANYHEKLSLNHNLQNLVSIERINYNYKDELAFEDLKNQALSVLTVLDNINPNSKTELQSIDHFRYYLFFKIHHYLEYDEMENAKSLMEIVQKNTKLDQYPFQSKDITGLYQQLILQIEK